MKALMRNTGGIADEVKKVYAEPALVPETPWLASGKLPAKPEVKRETVNGRDILRIQARHRHAVRRGARTECGSKRPWRFAAPPRTVSSDPAAEGRARARQHDRPHRPRERCGGGEVTATSAWRR